MFSNSLIVSLFGAELQVLKILVSPVRFLVTPPKEISN